MESKVNVLFCKPPVNASDLDAQIAYIKEAMDQYVGWYKIIETMEEYGALTDAEKQVDCIVVMGGKSCVVDLLKAQV